MRERPVLSAPRRWSDELEGIRWLPRLIDKARMAQSQRLGAYLFGHSPFDAALLRRLGVTTKDFASIVNASADDAAVLAALRARGFDEARVRRWSDRLPDAVRFYAPIWDIDDGYVRPNALGRAMIAVWRGIERPTMALVRLVLRSP
jgi:uncharacterized protein DUF5069